MLNSITGVNALTGAEQKWAQEKAAADNNAAGGITLADGKTHKIVLKFCDDKSSDTEAAAAMEKLIKTDGLKIIPELEHHSVQPGGGDRGRAVPGLLPRSTRAGPTSSGAWTSKWSTDIFESAADAGLAAIGAAENMA